LTSIRYALKEFIKLAVQPYDIVVIGGGVGGYSAALRAAGAGVSVALIEKHLIGGTCLNVGCIPTKALLESCKLLRSCRRAADLGVRVREAIPEPQAIVERSQSVVGLMRKGVEDLLERRGVTVIRGQAELLGPTRVGVASGGDAATLETGSVIVATGSSWVQLPAVHIDGRRIITSDHALRLDDVSSSLVIIGGGAVGCEFAEIYSALGAEVTIVEMMDQLLPGEDSELARRLEASIKRKGIKVMTGSRVAAITASGAQLEVGIEDGRGLVADRVLVAVGRKPNTEGLGLERAGVETTGRGIRTDDGMRTNASGVFAVGDVTGDYLLAHVATAQGIVAAENACGGHAKVDYSAVPRCVYTDPEYAAVGMTEAQASDAGLRTAVQKVRLGRIGRALTMGETFGLAKLVVDRDSERVLGFQAVAPHASEFLSEISLAITKGLRPDDIARVIHPHPTLSEIVWEAAQGALGKPVHGE
jgi:dihydrolipoamide dehydrogenase